MAFHIIFDSQKQHCRTIEPLNRSRRNRKQCHAILVLKSYLDACLSFRLYHPPTMLLPLLTWKSLNCCCGFVSWYYDIATVLSLSLKCTSSNNNDNACDDNPQQQKKWIIIIIQGIITICRNRIKLNRLLVGHPPAISAPHHRYLYPIHNNGYSAFHVKSTWRSSCRRKNALQFGGYLLNCSLPLNGQVQVLCGWMQETVHQVSKKTTRSMDGLIKYKYGRYQFLLLYLSYHLSILIDKAGHYFCGDRP